MKNPASVRAAAAARRASSSRTARVGRSQPWRRAFSVSPRDGAGAEVRSEALVGRSPSSSSSSRHAVRRRRASL
ncbi:hypothetical protein K1J57_33210 (plasmid) [Nocardiopsis sp. MT53]|uniref:hypothetical protein n=1 Tax=Nocardiopsis sp. MT53 TaxID=2865672 RepID=UPI001C739A5B|nr:hypothetical protein [Nocardiopsis sp. MT53]QYX40859.1 hypothetical protein K1J57_33210 [Nocardiopsis sp. MT53]